METSKLTDPDGDPVTLDEAKSVLLRLQPVPEAIFHDAEYDDGQEPVRGIGWLVDGRYHGWWIHVYSDQWCIAQMKDGAVAGEVCYYNFDGSPRAAGIQFGKLRSGWWRMYEGGVLESTCEYRDDELTGNVCRHHENGTVWLKGKVVDGSWVGQVREYDSEGNLIGEGPLSPGESPARTGHWKRYEKGEVVGYGEMVKGRPTGVWKLLQNGRVVGERLYHDGEAMS